MKELSIKEKAKAYDEALERAKKWYNAPNIDKIPTYGNRIIEEIFPELKESEDEIVIAALKSGINGLLKEEYHLKGIGGISFNKINAWLEKQGNPTDINPSEFDLRLNKLLKQFETLPKEELASSLSFYLNVVQNDGTYKEEKQGEQKHANKVEPKDYNGIDPYFGKPVDKVEPKFKVGDWVVLNGVNGNPVQITSFEEDKGVGIKVWFSNGTGTWVDYPKGYHKWTIEDARDGDVLADNLGVILFKSIRDNNVINYYAYLSGIFSVQKDEEYWGYAVNCTLSPATKEQRERFFAAMHDAGYEWDAEKKELKEIKNEIEIPLGAKDSELHEVSYYIPEGYYAEIDDDGVIIKKGKKPSAWSGEDNTYYDDICEILINLIHSETAKVNKNAVQKDLDWLMSIQQRIETK